jgi:hypothetical protein
MNKGRRTTNYAAKSFCIAIYIFIINIDKHVNKQKHHTQDHFHLPTINQECNAIHSTLIHQTQISLFT